MSGPQRSVNRDARPAWLATWVPLIVIIGLIASLPFLLVRLIEWLVRP